MLRLGLTGGIASGKSAVAAMLRELGFAVLDADSLAHRLIEPGQPAVLRRLREVALDWMQRLAPFNPYLTGAVLGGTPAAHA